MLYVFNSPAPASATASAAHNLTHPAGQNSPSGSPAALPRSISPLEAPQLQKFCIPAADEQQPQLAPLHAVPANHEQAVATSLQLSPHGPAQELSLQEGAAAEHSTTQDRLHLHHMPAHAGQQETVLIGSAAHRNKQQPAAAAAPKAVGPPIASAAGARSLSAPSLPSHRNNNSSSSSSPVSNISSCCSPQPCFRQLPQEPSATQEHASQEQQHWEEVPGLQWCPRDVLGCVVEEPQLASAVKVTAAAVLNPACCQPKNGSSSSTTAWQLKAASSGTSAAVLADATAAAASKAHASGPAHPPAHLVPAGASGTEAEVDSSSSSSKGCDGAYPKVYLQWAKGEAGQGAPPAAAAGGGGSVTPGPSFLRPALVKQYQQQRSLSGKGHLQAGVSGRLPKETAENKAGGEASLPTGAGAALLRGGTATCSNNSCSSTVAAPAAAAAAAVGSVSVPAKLWSPGSAYSSCQAAARMAGLNPAGMDARALTWHQKLHPGAKPTRREDVQSLKRWLLQQLAVLQEEWEGRGGNLKEEECGWTEVGLCSERRDQGNTGLQKHQQQQLEGKQTGLAKASVARVPSPPPVSTAAGAAGIDDGYCLQEQTSHLLLLVAGEGGSGSLDVELLGAQQVVYSAAFEGLCR